MKIKNQMAILRTLGNDEEVSKTKRGEIYLSFLSDLETNYPEGFTSSEAVTFLIAKIRYGGEAWSVKEYTNGVRPLGLTACRKLAESKEIMNNVKVVDGFRKWIKQYALQAIKEEVSFINKLQKLIIANIEDADCKKLNELIQIHWKN